MRLNRFLASAGLGSRRSVEELILAGKVRLNGQVVTHLATQVHPGDSVKVGSRLIRSELPLTAVLYKPAGYLCSASDDRGRKTIFDLLPRNWPRVFHVGRLDKESEGLLLVTNDGDLANALMHPRYKVEKEYEVTTRQPFDPKLIPKLLHGVHIEGGRAKAERARLEGPKHLRLVLTQGINRQIHKMLWRVGEYDVERLARVRIGDISIQGLRPGGWRLLTQKELAALYPKGDASE
jgi:23S rRNA pseudouridine2605 synthase